MNNTTEDERGGIQSVARAAAILRALAHQRRDMSQRGMSQGGMSQGGMSQGGMSQRGMSQRGMSLGEIARVVSLPRSTVQRLVQALEHERLVEVGGAGGPGVRLGPALAELAGAIRVDVVRMARPHLEALFETLHETVDIAQAHGREVRFLDQIASDRELRAVPRRDVGLLLHCMANGKALLSAMPDAAVGRLLGSTLPAPTQRSITSLPALLTELAEIRRTGFAYDRQELTDGICAIGTLVTAGAQHYAVSVVVPAQRFEAALADIRAALLACKAGLEADLRSAVAA